MTTEYDERVARLRKLYSEVSKLEAELNDEIADKFGEDSFHFTKDVDGLLIMTKAENNAQIAWDYDRLPISRQEIIKLFKRGRF